MEVSASTLGVPHSEVDTCYTRIVKEVEGGGTKVVYIPKIVGGREEEECRCYVGGEEFMRVIEGLERGYKFFTNTGERGDRGLKEVRGEGED